MNPMRFPALSALTLVMALAWSPARAADAPASGGKREMVACMADENAPFSAAGSGGIDVDLSRSLGELLQREVRVSWITVPVRGGFGKALRQAMKPGGCDLFFGIPVHGGSNEDVAEQRLELSEPYVSLGYVLVAANGSSVRTLEDARRAPRVGVVTATPADMYLHKQGFNRIPYGDNGDLLDALATGAVNAAVVWLPALVNAERRGFKLWPNAVRDERSPWPELETGFAIALRSGDQELKASVNSALESMRGNASLNAILQRHGVLRTSAR